MSSILTVLIVAAAGAMACWALAWRSRYRNYTCGAPYRSAVLKEAEALLSDNDAPEIVHRAAGLMLAVLYDSPAFWRELGSFDSDKTQLDLLRYGAYRQRVKRMIGLVGIVVILEDRKLGCHLRQLLKGQKSQTPDIEELAEGFEHLPPGKATAERLQEKVLATA
jgi:hypothetical protein